jgi:DNA-binding beta-propeller fold protein YncE
MKSIRNRTTVITKAVTAILGLALIALASCSSGDDSTSTVTTNSSAGLQGPLVFVNNTGDKTLTSVALKGDSGNAVVNTLGPGVFGNVALGDMQFSEGEWIFMNLGLGNSVALIDPLSGATPVFEKNTQVGNRPVHIYRDPTDGEVIWSMIDGSVAAGLDDVPATIPQTPPQLDEIIDCTATGGGAVTIFHNSHLGPGGEIPKIIGKVCLYAKGHKVTAFSSGAGVLKRAFVSSEVSGEISVINNDETSPDYLKLINRIDLCNSTKEAVPATCDNESATPLTMPFTPNNSAPHGIRWSKLTQKVYSIQEGYNEIAEIDPTTFAITNTFDLTGLPYTAFGMSPDGRFLLLRGYTTPATGTKLGVLDLSVTPAVRTDFTIAALDGTSPGSFKFSPDGKRFYILAGNTATSTKKDRLFAFNASTLTAATPALTLLREITLVATGGHSFDVHAQGAGEAKYIAVSNSTDNSLSIINATDNLIKQTVTNVGSTPGSILGGIMIYAPGSAAAGNQATSSLTGGSKAKPSVLPERLDDHGMPE